MRRPFFQAIATLTKTDIWLQIAVDLGLWSPMYIKASDPANKFKLHTGGRCENRRNLREAKGYTQTSRGYLVRA
jgi:hypothetical protein